MTTFEKVAIIANRLNKMPIPYTTYTGIKCETFYTTREMLENIVIKIGSDNTIEQDYRTLEKSCLKEMGFSQYTLTISLMVELQSLEYELGRRTRLVWSGRPSLGSSIWQ